MKKLKYYLSLTLFTLFLFGCSVLLLSLESIIDLLF
jgi:PBP1b-binding outer membrane lipoprotein LpoB